MVSALQPRQTGFIGSAETEVKVDDCVVILHVFVQRVFQVATHQTQHHTMAYSSQT